MHKWIVVVGLITPTWVLAQTLDQRVERLEQITNNPITIQLGQRLDFQANELAEIQDRLDRLLFQNQQLQRQLERHIEQSSQRLAELETKLELAGSVVKNHDRVDDKRMSAVEEWGTDLAVSDSSLTDDSADVREGFVLGQPSPVESGDSMGEMPSATDSMQQEYDQAFALLGTGDYEAAQQALMAFIERYPSENLTADAYYWLGESWLIQQDFGQALQAFEVIINDFNDHSRLQNALLRGGDSLVGLNNLDQAVEFYNRVLESFPQSRTAQSAQERLTRLQVLN
ncbi:tol-pal system protein YbgF [Thiomicrospira sp. ALE5]|uniref:tol-pal system protein YbgF n=1 Tax=Thiomicrospira sp. ALE5 TaxID=748650 RepID=UPI0008F0DCE0|nr:tol-pal system protein YbgF [Thiomicrospira sp. ALE5]SFR51100.1 tol-pal system protein YbgF [Thiomicrospira sp. ALE5]